MENDRPRRVRRTSRAVEEAARQLRRALTPAERVLWEALRGRQLDGLKFRRQHPVGLFILDFYCPEYKLVIELDGEIHDKQIEYDAARTQELEAYGYQVLRFRNEAVMNNLNAVLECIARVAFR